MINVLNKVCKECRWDIMNLMERKCLVTENQGGFMGKEEFEIDSEQQAGYLNSWKLVGKALWTGGTA